MLLKQYMEFMLSTNTFETASQCVVEPYLPPGYRFHPTDEELVVFYLANKVANCRFTVAAIGEADLNKSEPWDLPEKAKTGEKEWYFFSLKDRKYPTGLRTNRATGAGYWKATGKDREVTSGRPPMTVQLVGMKKTLVFYKGRAPKGEKTNWIMHEYRLAEPCIINHLSKSAKDEWVVCRIFKKNSGGKKAGSSSMQGEYHQEAAAAASTATNAASTANQYGGVREEETHVSSSIDHHHFMVSNKKHHLQQEVSSNNNAYNSAQLPPLLESPHCTAGGAAGYGEADTGSAITDHTSSDHTHSTQLNKNTTTLQYHDHNHHHQQQHVQCRNSYLHSHTSTTAAAAAATCASSKHDHYNNNDDHQWRKAPLPPSSLHPGHPFDPIDGLDQPLLLATNPFHQVNAHVDAIKGHYSTYNQPNTSLVNTMANSNLELASGLILKTLLNQCSIEGSKPTCKVEPYLNDNEETSHLPIPNFKCFSNTNNRTLQNCASGHALPSFLDYQPPNLNDPSHHINMINSTINATTTNNLPCLGDLNGATFDGVQFSHNDLGALLWPSY